MIFSKCSLVAMVDFLVGFLKQILAKEVVEEDKGLLSDSDDLNHYYIDNSIIKTYLFTEIKFLVVVSLISIKLI